MKTIEFKNYHPVVNLVYFIFTIGFSCFLMHPVCLTISLLSAFVYSVIIKGVKSARSTLSYILPMLIFMTIVNPLFNHRGITIIGYMPSGNPITLESVTYGLAAAIMIVSVICHFSCFNEIMTSDKLVYLFGRIFPSLSLIFSMTLRFVPRFSAELKSISNTQKTMGRNITQGSIPNRVKSGLSILSIMTTKALENSIETADSMKARGFGLRGRTAFSIFAFTKRDIFALIWIVFHALYIFTAIVKGQIDAFYFPAIEWAEPSLYNLSVFISYLLLCTYPIIIELWEVIRWRFIKSKI